MQQLWYDFPIQSHNVIKNHYNLQILEGQGQMQEDIGFLFYFILFFIYSFMAQKGKLSFK